MLRTMLLGAALAVGMSSVASAAMLPAPVGNGDAGIVRVAEGCGPGFWRSPNGVCHPMAVGRVCPRGYHLGPEGRRCWPN
jgi:hypothetical protein